MKEQILKSLSTLNIKPTKINWLFLDNSGAVLLFDNKDEIKTAKERLNTLESNGKLIYNVSGNGWGTGISLMKN